MAQAPVLAWFLPSFSPRAQFVIETLFRDWLAIPVWVGHPNDNPPPAPYRISYGIKVAGAFSLPCSNFLWRQDANFFLPKWDKVGLFPFRCGDYDYDLLAMAFYVLSLYPLYDWPYGYDAYGLYQWEKLPFYEAPFWQEPFLQGHVYRFLDWMGYSYRRPVFSWEVGWDIDHPYAWRGRWGLRWWMGGLRRANLHHRLLAQMGLISDPYDTLEAILSSFPPAHSRFFFLMSSTHRLDSLVRPSHPVWKQWVQQVLRGGYVIGLHPSYEVMTNPQRLSPEKARLEKYAGRPVTTSRQHYLRYRWPQTFYHLAAIGIQEDYTLAFPERSGFLLGTALPTRLYDIYREKPLPLVFRPPALMDQVYVRRGDYGGLAAEVQRLYAVVRQSGGHLHFIWHNSTWDAAEPIRALFGLGSACTHP